MGRLVRSMNSLLANPDSQLHVRNCPGDSLLQACYGEPETWHIGSASKRDTATLPSEFTLTWQLQ